MTEPTAIELSVVVPVYGCEGCLRSLHAQLSQVVAPLTSEYELIFVDDRSQDGAWDLLKSLAKDDPKLTAMRLSRNFGQHAAITAGLSRSRGRWTVVMDCDLQDPPEEIPKLYAKATEGFDIVYARRRRRGTSVWRRMTARIFFRVMNVFANAEFEGSGTFSILSRPVVTAFLGFRDRRRHYLLILHWLGFNATAIEYEQDQRHTGDSSYSLGALLAHALDGMFFQTTVLLRWIVYLGFVLSALGLGFAAFILLGHLFGMDSYPGWSSLAVFILTVGGFIIVSTGITGLYIGRVFEQVRERPLFVVDEEIRAEISVPGAR